ncbi:MAG: lysophospholipid acyltransferase family protein [Campylobacteraceae bacterium]
MLLSIDEVVQNSRLKYFGIFGRFFAWIFLKITKIDYLNKRYKLINHLPQDEFLDEVVENVLKVPFEVHKADLSKIPTTGPFIIISNHPLGALDGLLLIYLISKIRPDFKIMANFMLKRIKNLEDIFIPVNPFENSKDSFNSLKGMIGSLKHLQNGGCIGIFPSGEVSNKNLLEEVEDRPWQLTAIKLIKKAKVPIIPIFFNAKNSSTFYWLGKANPALRTIMLPREMLREFKKPIQIRIGKQIPLIKQAEHENLEDFAEYLRRKTYVLSSYYNKDNFKKNIKKIKDKILVKDGNQNPEEIVPFQDTIAIEKELELIKNEALLFTHNNKFECYFAKAKDIPNALNEIGRLREVTFRNVGEGTNKSIDLDEYDKNYNHLFLWDKTERKIAGAYRIGLGSEIYEKHGIKGFYLSELFKFSPKSHYLFFEGMELGRAFVSIDYQRQPMPLLLLWRGIVHIILKEKNINYIIGGVSISNQFSNFSKSVIVEFMRSNYFDSYISKFIKAKNEYKVTMSEENREFVLKEMDKNINNLDSLVEEFEPNMLRLPVLFKKYIKQNAKLMAFNVDPNFNNAVDGLMYIKTKDIPLSTIQPVLDDIAKGKMIA